MKITPLTEGMTDAQMDELASWLMDLYDDNDTIARNAAVRVTAWSESRNRPLGAATQRRVDEVLAPTEPKQAMPTHFRLYQNGTATSVAPTQAQAQAWVEARPSGRSYMAVYPVRNR